MNKLKYIARIVLGTIVAIWFLAFIVPKIPVVQEKLGYTVSSALAEKLGTKVHIGQVDIRLPWRLVIDDVILYDQQGKVMLQAGRIAAGIEYLPLLEGRIVISSAQLFATHITLYQKDAHSPLNCQFVIDSLKSKDTTSHTPLNLAIASVVIRHSSVRYDRIDVPSTIKHHPSSLNPHHLCLNELSSNIILHTLTDDSLNVQLKHFSCTEQSGLQLKELTGSVRASKKKVTVSGLKAVLPHSTLNIDELISPLNKEQGEGHLVVNASITPSDLAWLEPRLSSFDMPLTLRALAYGSAKKIKASLSASLTDRSLKLYATATAYDVTSSPHGTLNISELHASQQLIRSLSKLGIPVPQQIRNLGDINIQGCATAYSKTSFFGNATIALSNAGKASLKASYNDKALKAHVQTSCLALNKITGSNKLGNIVCNLDVSSPDVTKIKRDVSVRGNITEFTFNDYTYRNVRLNGSLRGNIVNGAIDIDDPNASLHAKGCANIVTKDISYATVDIRNFSPKRMNITDILGDSPLSAQLSITPHDLTLTSDIIDMKMDGDIELASLPYSITNIISEHLPSCPGLPKHIHTHNDFKVATTVKDVSILQRLLKSNISVPEGITLNGFVNDKTHQADLLLDIPSMTISDRLLQGTKLHLTTPDNAVHTALTTSMMVDEHPTAFSVDCNGKNDVLTTTCVWDNQREAVFKGCLFTNTTFGRSPSGKASVSAVIPFSTLQIGDSVWTIQAQRLQYADDIVSIDNLHVGSNSQKLFINGSLSKNTQDSLVCDLRNINVRYILDLVDFHSVDFDGSASGHFVAHSLLTDIKAKGFLDVHSFQFEKGDLGDMHIDAAYSNITKRIDIEAVADDPEGSAKTLINGYVAPTSPGGLDLDIQARNSRLDFMQTFCESFMKDAKLNGNGRVRLFGPFDNINLEGSLCAKGSFTLASTNCRYTLPGDSVRFIPDDIQFNDVPLHDSYGNEALLHGAIHHQHLTNMSYDLDATTMQFLAYDFPTLKDEDSFCGHALISGDIGIHGKGNELLISADATPLRGSYLTYNASSPESVRSGEIITWRSASQMSNQVTDDDTPHPTPDLMNDDAGNDRTNIHMQFQIHANTDAKLHLIMDELSGDYIDIFGNGDLRVDYYNKGAFNIFGNYVVDNGTYKMTLQNIIRRDFSFHKGGTITFGGDPYNALINMQAVYALNSVPLADLNIGSNFSTNNVPVNCLMNITGTPGKPKIAFGVELPTLSTDARQMVNSVINSEEEMNQQVLYLLAIGRFYAPNSTANLASTTTTTSSAAGAANQEISQSSLAIQSFLSGTLSQSFNNMMSSVMSGLMRSGNTLNFGANIAPGNEGFNNAEYEGLVNGNFFNNRLKFNAQFGYRDRVSTNTSSFIGDFSLQYVLTKNGFISLKVYNQSNDRYFTKNALNTQGIGLVFQKEWGK